jgi:hypothetical protein
MTAMQMFAVVAECYGGLFLVSEFSTQERAQIALSENLDRRPLFVVPAEVCLTPKGNVRLWKSAPAVPSERESMNIPRSHT